MNLTDFYLDEGKHDPGTFKAIFIAGPPGAGKNTVITELGLTAAGLKLQDIDHALSYLRSIHPEKANYPISIDITKRRHQLLQKNMLGMLINTTGRKYESIMRLNKELKATGYQTFMLFVDVEYDVAFHRVNQREKYATDPKDIARPVTPDYFEHAFDAAKQNIEFYRTMFGANFALITNNVFIDVEADIGPTEDEKEEYEATLRYAAKKVERFLNKPVLAKAA